MNCSSTSIDVDGIDSSTEGVAEHSHRGWSTERHLRSPPHRPSRPDQSFHLPVTVAPLTVPVSITGFNTTTTISIYISSYRHTSLDAFRQSYHDSVTYTVPLQRVLLSSFIFLQLHIIPPHIISTPSPLTPVEPLKLCLPFFSPTGSFSGLLFSSISFPCLSHPLRPLLILQQPLLPIVTLSPLRGTASTPSTAPSPSPPSNPSPLLH